jgi:hypothetical protein
MAGITDLRYIRRRNLKHEQNIQKEYFREIVHSYGIDLRYFRKYLDFYQSPSGIANYTYGEDPTATYYLSGDMICYMEMMGDAFLLSKFGIETDGDCAIYFTIDDFNEQFRDKIGITMPTHFRSDLYSEIEHSTALLTGVVQGDGLSGEVRINVAPVASGDFIQGVREPIIIYPNAVNPDVKGPAYYDYGQYDSTGFLTGDIYGFTDASGNGWVSGSIDGEILHTTKPAELRNITWEDISPQVGDFFRIDFEETNQEEYEITRVHDRNLQTDGLNPLLGKYIWRCDCVRRDPSHEEVIGDIQEEHLTTDRGEQNIWHEDISNEIFEYDTQPVDEVDGINSDSVYGDY